MVVLKIQLFIPLDSRKKKISNKPYLGDFGRQPGTLGWVGDLGVPVGVGLPVLVHMFLQVHVQVLEDHVELVLGVHHVQQLDHGRVLQLLQEGDLTDGGAGDTFRFTRKKRRRKMLIFREKKGLSGMERLFMLRDQEN